MRKLLISLFGVVVSVSAAQAGQAKFKIIYHHGAWSTLSGMSTDDKPMCIVADEGHNWFFAYKYEAGYHFITGQIVKKSWDIPKGTHIPITIRVDNYAPWSVNGVGSGDQILWPIKGSALNKFSAQFKVGQELSIIFDSGTEPAWHLSLDGSYGATDRMVQCIENVRASLDSPPQSDSTAPSQPYSPAPTQPFAAPAQPDSPGAGSAVPNGPTGGNDDNGPQV